ncbi:MAG: hypothetical protein ACJAVA_000257 [Flavobacteriaceae bacterium]|jgi:hypothetical protein
MINKIKNHKDYYKLPLHTDKYGSYVWAKNGTMAMMFNSKVSKEDRNKIVERLNGNNDLKIPNIKKDGIDFYDGDNYIFCVRGWGGLTGSGALNMKENAAAKIQDDFCDFIETTLKS